MAFNASSADIAIASSQQLDALYKEQRKSFFRQRLTFHSKTTRQAFFSLDTQNPFRSEFTAINNSCSEDLSEVHRDLFRGGHQLTNGVTFNKDPKPPLIPPIWLKTLLIDKMRPLFGARHSDDQLANIFWLLSQPGNPVYYVTTQIIVKMATPKEGGGFGGYGMTTCALPQEVDANSRVINFDDKYLRSDNQTNQDTIVQPWVGESERDCGVTIIHTIQCFRMVIPHTKNNPTGELNSTVSLITKSGMNIRLPLMTMICRVDTPLRQPRIGDPAFINSLNLEITIYEPQLKELLEHVNKFLCAPNKDPIILHSPQARALLVREAHAANRLIFGPDSSHAFGLFSQLSGYAPKKDLATLSSRELENIYQDLHPSVQLANTDIWDTVEETLRSYSGNRLLVNDEAVRTVLVHVLQYKIRQVFSESLYNAERIANIYLLTIVNRNNPIYQLVNFIMKIFNDLGVQFCSPQVCVDPIYQRLGIRTKDKKKYQFFKPTLIIADKDQAGVGFTQIYSAEYTQMTYQKETKDSLPNNPFLRIYLEVYIPLREAFFQPKRLEFIGSASLPSHVFLFLSDKITARVLVKLHQELLAKRKAGPKKVERASPPPSFSPVASPSRSAKQDSLDDED